MEDVVSMSFDLMGFYSEVDGLRDIQSTYWRRAGAPN